MITNQIVEILIMVDYDLFSLAAVVVGNSYSDSLSMKVSQVSTSVGWFFQIIQFSSEKLSFFGFE
jgi:hypothetical protein